VLQAGVGGQREIRHVQALLIGANKQLEAKLLVNTRAAVKPVKTDIPATAVARMPSGYGPILARSLKIATRVSGGSTIRASVNVSAKGKIENRDVPTLNRGRLRHPLFGRRKHWYTTAVRPGFVSDPIDRLAKRVGDGAEKAANDVADSILED